MTEYDGWGRSELGAKRSGTYSQWRCRFGGGSRTASDSFPEVIINQCLWYSPVQCTLSVSHFISDILSDNVRVSVEIIHKADYDMGWAAYI